MQTPSRLKQKKVGSETSAKRGELVTVACTVNATGKMLLEMQPHPGSGGATERSIGHATKSGYCTWMKKLLSCSWSTSYVTQTAASWSPVLLILYNHDTHLSLKAVKTTKKNGVVVLITSPKQSIDHWRPSTSEPWIVGHIQNLVKPQHYMIFHRLTSASLWFFHMCP